MGGVRAGGVYGWCAWCLLGCMMWCTCVVCMGDVHGCAWVCMGGVVHTWCVWVACVVVCMGGMDGVVRHVCI